MVPREEEGVRHGLVLGLWLHVLEVGSRLALELGETLLEARTGIGHGEHVLSPEVSPAGIGPAGGGVWEGKGKSVEREPVAKAVFGTSCMQPILETTVIRAASQLFLVDFHPRLVILRSDGFRPSDELTDPRELIGKEAT